MTEVNIPPVPSPPPVDRLTLFGIPTTMTPQQQAQVRQVITIIATVAATLGVISTTGAIDLTNKLMDLGGAITGILTAVSAGIVAFNQLVTWYRTSRSQSIARVAALPNTMVVQTTPGSGADAHVANELAKVPGTVAVLTDSATAAAAPSPKVTTAPA